MKRHLANKQDKVQINPLCADRIMSYSYYEKNWANYVPMRYTAFKRRNSPYFVVQKK